MSESRKIVKSTLVVSAATMVSRVLGYLRDMLLFQYFDKTSMDAFVAAFRLPNLMRRLLGEGALSVSFIPIFTDHLHNKSKEQTKEFVAACFTFLSIVLVMLTLLVVIFSRPITEFLAMGPAFAGIPQKYELAAKMLMIMFPYLCFISLVALAMGILNSVKHFFAPAFAPVFLNLFMIAAILYFQNKMDYPIISVAWAVFFSGLAQVFLQIPWLIKKGYLPRINFDWHNPGLRRVTKLMLPAILGLSSVQISVLMIQEFASYLPYEGAVSYLYLGNRLTELPLGVFAVAIGTALLPNLSSHAITKNHIAFKKNFIQAINGVSFISWPSMAGFIILGEPLIKFMFERGKFTSSETHATALALIYYSVGLWAGCLLRVLVPAFYALQNTFIPALTSFICLGFNAVFCYFLIKPLAHGGLALATSLTAFLQVLILFIYFHRKYLKFSLKELLIPQLKLCVATVVMSVALLTAQLYFSQRVGGSILWESIYLSSLILLSMLVYGAVSYFVGFSELTLLLRMVFKRKQSGASTLTKSVVMTDKE